nr:MAG TPA: hypothetical protein [Caudoviricetes sp.]
MIEGNDQQPEGVCSDHNQVNKNPVLRGWIFFYASGWVGLGRLPANQNNLSEIFRTKVINLHTTFFIINRRMNFK